MITTLSIAKKHNEREVTLIDLYVKFAMMNLTNVKVLNSNEGLLIW